MYFVPRQAGSNLAGFTQPGVPQHVFLGTIWAGVIISCLFLGGRLYSRFRGPQRLFADDYLATLAFVLVAVTGGLWQYAARDMYYVLNVQSGIEPFEANFFDRMHRWLMVTLIVELFFYTSLVTVKLSLLLFFRRLDAQTNFLKWFWWPTLLFTLATYFVSVGNVEYKCLLGSTETILGVCNAPETIHYIDITLKLNCTLDVFSEFLIMLLPFILLRNVRVRLGKKIAFVGLFSLSVLTMAIATARAADINVTRRADGQIDNTYLWLWSATEPHVAIIVSCLSAFPALFRFPSGKEKKFSPSESYLRMMSRIRSSRSKKAAGEKTDTILADLSMVSTSDGLDYMRAHSGGENSSRGNDSHDSRQPVLAPPEKYGKPVVASCYYGATAGVDGRDGNVVVPRRDDQNTQNFENRESRRGSRAAACNIDIECLDASNGSRLQLLHR